MKQYRNLATRIIGLIALLAPELAAAQPIFQSAATYPLGTSTGSQLAVLAIADIGLLDEEAAAAIKVA